VPNSPECQKIADAVDALVVQEKAKRDAIAALTGIDKWKAMQELGAIRQQLADQQAILSECEKQHASDLATEIVVLDVPNVSGPNRVARMWQLTSGGQTVKQTATVQNGIATFSAIPVNARQSFGLTIEETDHPKVSGPDFRSGPLPPATDSPQSDAVTRIEIVILDPIVITTDALSPAVPPLPIPLSYPGGLFGSISLSVTGLGFFINNGALSISAIGTAAGVTISSPFNFSAIFHVAPTFGMAPSTIVEISGAVPTLTMPSVAGTLISDLTSFISPRLLSLTLPTLSTRLNKLIVDQVCASLGLRVLPSGSVLSVRQLDMDGNGITLTPALAAFGRVLSNFQPGAPDAVTRLVTLDLNPTSISTSDTANRIAQGRVTLSGPAPPGGVSIALLCDKPEAAHVDPASLAIIEGQTSGVFTVTGIGQPLMQLQHIDATITATLADQTLTTSISVRPETPITPIQQLSSSFLSPQTGQFELEILQAVNQYRLGKQLQALAFDQACSTQPQSHSIDMAAGRVPLGHDGFELRSAAIASSTPGGHPPGAAEQVAAGQQTAQDVVQGWVQEKLPGGTNLSPIEGAYTMAGVGAARSPAGLNYFTIIFA